MHDALAVRAIERVGDLGSVTQRLIQRQRSLGQPVRERLPFQQLHDEVLGSVLMPHVVERADVRMGELRDRLRLALEALERLRGGGRGSAA